KPCHDGQGRGVSVKLTDASAVAAAYRLAAAERDSVVVEKFTAGEDHRVLVVAGKGVAAACRRPDGVADVADRVHPDNKAILERAATATELAVAEVSFVIEDIAQPWRQAGGAVLSLETRPDLRSHWLERPGRSVTGPILRALLGGSDGRIPT